jgi:hypothetical protein
VLPASLMIIFVCVCSSLCGTFLSQTIAAIPGLHACHFVPISVCNIMFYVLSMNVCIVNICR